MAAPGLIAPLAQPCEPAPFEPALVAHGVARHRASRSQRLVTNFASGFAGHRLLLGAPRWGAAWAEESASRQDPAFATRVRIGAQREPERRE